MNMRTLREYVEDVGFVQWMGFYIFDFFINVKTDLTYHEDTVWVFSAYVYRVGWRGVLTKLAEGFSDNSSSQAIQVAFERLDTLE